MFDFESKIAKVLMKHRLVDMVLNPDYYCCSCGYKSMEQPSVHQAAMLIKLIRDSELEAKAWEAGVATALNHAILNEDGITLRLEHLDGRKWANPYRSNNE